MSNLKIEYMPGPTPEAKAAQLRQRELITALYAAYNSTRDYESPEYKKASAAYDESVQALEALLGPDVPCHFVDCGLADMFSDYYKDVNNFRPHGLGYTRQQVVDWCARQNALATEN